MNPRQFSSVFPLAAVFALLCVMGGCSRGPADDLSQLLLEELTLENEQPAEMRRQPKVDNIKKVWVRADDAFAGAIIEFSDEGNGAQQATLVYCPPEMIRWGWRPGELKIKQFTKADTHFECESLVKTFDERRRVVLDQWYEKKIVYPHGSDELIFRQKQGSDAVVGEWQRWLRLDEQSDHFVNYLFGKAMVAENNRQANLAVQYYRQAVLAAPKDARILNAFSWYLAVNPRPRDGELKTAIELAKRACELTKFLDAMYVDTLAAAYAANGDFDNAVKFQREACKLNNIAEFRSRLTLYRMNKPYIEGTSLAGVRPTPLGRATGASPIASP